MSLLVVGGLFGIGVIAFVGLIFIVRTAPDAEASANIPPPAPTVSASVPPPVPTTQKELGNHADADKSLAPVQVPPTPNIYALSSSDEHLASDWQPLASGQFYELKNELHTLHGQAQELESRLGNLIAMIERVEQAQDGRFPIEGQISDAAGNQAIH